MTYLGVVLAYFAGGIAAGAVVGALYPLSRRAWGAYAVALAAAVPVTVAIAVAVSGHPAAWDGKTQVTCVIFSLFLAAVIGKELRKTDGGL